MTNPAPRPAARSLTSAQRTKLRVRLEHELGEVLVLESQLRAQAQDALESRRGAGHDEAEDPEGSSLAFEGAQVTSMLKQTATHASEITAAIERIDAGTYGTCRRCEQPIAFGRLEARPSAALCITCAS